MRAGGGTRAKVRLSDSMIKNHFRQMESSRNFSWVRRISTIANLGAAKGHLVAARENRDPFVTARARASFVRAALAKPRQDMFEWPVWSWRGSESSRQQVENDMLKTARMDRSARNARILANLSAPQREHHDVTGAWLQQCEAGAFALGVGDLAPDFLLPDERGRLVSSRALLENGPIVLKFFCGNWCPFSIAELLDLDLVGSSPRIGNAHIVVLTAETARFGLALKQQHNLNMPILSDIGHAIGLQFGVVAALPAHLKSLFKGIGINLPLRHGTTEWMVPFPATFVIDQAGIIRAAFVEPDIMEVRDPRLIIEEVRRLDERGI